MSKIILKFYKKNVCGNKIKIIKILNFNKRLRKNHTNEISNRYVNGSVFDLFNYHGQILRLQLWYIPASALNRSILQKRILYSLINLLDAVQQKLHFYGTRMQINCKSCFFDTKTEKYRYSSETNLIH